MATLTIPDDVAALVHARAAEGGYDDVGAFLEALLLGGTAEDRVPEHLSVRSHEQLVALVRESLASPAREMTSADLDRMRADLVARHATPKGA